MPVLMTEKRDMDKIAAASKMAGEWWAERLADKYAPKREAFAKAVAAKVESVFRGEVRWDISGKRPGNGNYTECVHTGIYYEPLDLLLEALREAVDPKCTSNFRSTLNMLPYHLKLCVELKYMYAREGRSTQVKKILIIN